MQPNAAPGNAKSIAMPQAAPRHGGLFLVAGRNSVAHPLQTAHTAQLAHLAHTAQIAQMTQTGKQLSSRLGIQFGTVRSRQLSLLAVIGAAMSAPIIWLLHTLMTR